MKGILSSKSYWITSILATVIIFAAIFNFGQTYRAETDILISLKNLSASENIDQIAENAKQISGTLILYDEMLANNQEIKDPVAGKISNDRKKYWNSIIETQNFSGKGEVRLTILNDKQEEAEKISRAASLNLIQELGKYYNIDTEIDAKIIDGPITSHGKKYSNWILLAISSAISFSAVYFSYFLSDLLGGKKMTVAPENQTDPADKLNQEKAKEKLSKLLEGKL